MLKRLLPLLLILCFLPVGAWAAIEGNIPVASMEEIPPVPAEEDAWARELIAFWFNNQAVLTADYQAEYHWFRYVSDPEQLYYRTDAIQFTCERYSYSVHFFEDGTNVQLFDHSVPNPTASPSVEDMGAAISKLPSMAINLPAVRALLGENAGSFSNRRWAAYPNIYLYEEQISKVASYVYQWVPKEALEANGYTLPAGSIVSFYFNTDMTALHQVDITLP